MKLQYMSDMFPTPLSQKKSLSLSSNIYQKQLRFTLWQLQFRIGPLGLKAQIPRLIAVHRVVKALLSNKKVFVCESAKTLSKKIQPFIDQSKKIIGKSIFVEPVDIE